MLLCIFLPKTLHLRYLFSIRMDSPKSRKEPRAGLHKKLALKALKRPTPVKPMPPPPISLIRRKPKITYQSPSVHTTTELRIEASFKPLPQLASSSSTSSISSTSSATIALKRNINSKPLPRSTDLIQTLPLPTSSPGQKKKYPMGPPLPLYHPLGRLALSLPPLDPSAFGLPPPPPRVQERAIESNRRSSTRSRRPAEKLRDAEESAASVVPPVEPAPTPVPAPPVKEKASPRKRRAAGGGAGSKRKRKETDDGDAPYPAKRTRNPRGAAAIAAAAAAAAAEALVEPASAETSVPPTPAPEVPEEKVKEKSKSKSKEKEQEKEKRPALPERRSTRSRTGVKRRDSTGSVSEAASLASRGRSKVKPLDAIGIYVASGKKKAEDREEGEVSEEGKP